LTDEDYRQVYEELLTYDPAPPSPTEQRLALEAGNLSTMPLLGSASKSAEERISELFERLNRRVPAAELPLTPVNGEEEVENESLLSKLTNLRSGKSAATIQGESGTLSHILAKISPGEDVESETSPISVPSQSGQSTSTLVTRPHARRRGRVFNALSQLLQPIPGAQSQPFKLIIGEQPPNTINLDIATKQEWAALVLEAASDRSLTDVLTTFELMKVSSRVIYLENGQRVA